MSDQGVSDLVPRLEFENLEPGLKELFRPRVERLGYLGEFFKCSGHNPDVLVSFMEMTEALKEALLDRLTEVGSLTVAQATQNANMTGNLAPAELVAASA